MLNQNLNEYAHGQLDTRISKKTVKNNLIGKKIFCFVFLIIIGLMVVAVSWKLVNFFISPDPAKILRGDTYLGIKGTYDATNLTPDNVKNGVAFGNGLTGEFKSALPDTGQTMFYAHNNDSDYNASNSTTCDRTSSGDDPSFTDNGDGTITDNCTNLEWKKCLEPDISIADDWCGAFSYYTWEDAIAWCENLDFGGHTDWRLPNINELLSIFNYQNYNPSVNSTFFPSVDRSIMGDFGIGDWTSTTYDFNPELAWKVNFTGGTGQGRKGENDKAHARCVRN